MEKKLSYINSDMIKNKGKYSFFQLLREVYLSGFRFAKENQRLLPNGLMLANDKELYREIYGEHEDRSAEFFRDLLEYGKEQGEIDPAIDMRIVAKLLTGMTFSLTGFIWEDGKLDLDDMEIIDKMLYFIENGLKKKE